MRITHRRSDDGGREYDVLTQDEPRGRRHEAGRVSGLGQPPSVRPRCLKIQRPDCMKMPRRGSVSIPLSSAA